MPGKCGRLSGGMGRSIIYFSHQVSSTRQRVRLQAFGTARPLGTEQLNRREFALSMSTYYKHQATRVVKASVAEIESKVGSDPHWILFSPIAKLVDMCSDMWRNAELLEERDTLFTLIAKEYKSLEDELTGTRLYWRDPSNFGRISVEISETI